MVVHLHGKRPNEPIVVIVSEGVIVTVFLDEQPNFFEGANQTKAFEWRAPDSRGLSRTGILMP